MKKKVLLLIASITCAALFSGCGKDYDAKKSTVFVSKNGSVVSTDIESFDTDTFDTDDLQKYVDESIKSYNEANDGSVKLKSLSVEKKKAVLKIKYDSADEYTDFNGTELFSGTIAEALAAGYEFDVEFASIDDKSIKSCEKSEFMDNDGYKVVIYKGKSNISVDADILFTSTENIKLIDSKTVEVKKGSSIFDSKNEKTENVTEEDNKVEAQTTEADEMPEEDGSVSEDELLNSVQQEAEVTFDFSNEVDETEVINYITYVIYK